MADAFFFFINSSNSDFSESAVFRDNVIRPRDVPFFFLRFRTAQIDSRPIELARVRQDDRAVLLPSDSLREPDVHYAREYHLGCQPKNTAET